ncbi:MAG TPA: ABC transporter permease [Ktedonobacteraceae bacterium]|nr:ABC transporter permease [Ktedonobacteraceae bacterium]
MTQSTPNAPTASSPLTAQSSQPLSLGSLASQNAPRNIWLVLAYEYHRRVTQRSFRISTILILILIVLGSGVPTLVQYLTTTSQTSTRITVLNQAGTIGGMNNEQLHGYLETALNGSTGSASPSPGAGSSAAQAPRFALTVTSTANLTQLTKQVKDGSEHLLLVIDRTSNQDLRFTSYTSANPLTDTSSAQIQALATQLSLLDRSVHLGLTATQSEHLFAASQFVSIAVGQTGRSGSSLIAGYVLAYVGVILIFMSVYLYGYWVATGVAEEKGNRIMELLVNAATPFQLMSGKILGIGAAGLTQMAAFVIAGIGALLLQNPLKTLFLGSTVGGLSLEVTGNSIGLLLLLLLYFVLGFLLYASIFAAVGALVTRQEEIQNTVQLPMWLMMIGYVVSFFGFASPNALWIKVISYIPFWSPTAMLMRLGLGSVAWWEIALTVALMSLTIVGCTVVSARIYRIGVLMYGQKLGLGRVLKLMRQS